MGWLDYKRLLDTHDADPESWQAAADANPNTPADALRLAVRQADPVDVAATFAGLQRAAERLHSHAARQAEPYHIIERALGVVAAENYHWLRGAWGGERRVTS